MGSFVRSWHRDLVALDGRSAGGTAWVLLAGEERGGVHPVADADLPAGALWTDTPGDDGHHGYVHVGPVTASPPHGGPSP